MLSRGRCELGISYVLKADVKDAPSAVETQLRADVDFSGALDATAYVEMGSVGAARGWI